MCAFCIVYATDNAVHRDARDTINRRRAIQLTRPVATVTRRTTIARFAWRAAWTVTVSKRVQRDGAIALRLRSRRGWFRIVRYFPRPLDGRAPRPGRVPLLIRVTSMTAARTGLLDARSSPLFGNVGTCPIWQRARSSPLPAHTPTLPNQSAAIRQCWREPRWPLRRCPWVPCGLRH